ncbi:fatty acid synthase S-acetyltransferase [Aspergillus uvarum CBS 121591]|uniref:Fatty acid synthase S-acetyltransferase n=1 Tax=Aspergillus uvarum CBS 121591 TaxID=1448315 RepID=A0A319D5C1_9EURO|nr:fatty acid synthase S-acetyltransferase [Aspergillus uvarum CBS 121591]PYH86223.1 fatty acid synthase S-acetyltransferase [Aspergillus uvarum CBS 121591]
MSHSQREPIAVVGIGCRLPGGISSTQELWDALRQGLDLVTDVPGDRFDINSFHDPDSQAYGAIRNRKGGFVDDISAFDAEFFGFYPTEASKLDPQQRMVLEASFHALEDSGTPLEQVSGSRTSVFLGTFMYDHLAMQTEAQQRDNITPHIAMGSTSCAIANRVSHRLNLQGPSVSLDTACSSSLVSVHLACQSIWSGDGDAALAGGVNAILRPETSILLSKGGFLGPDGQCKSFDAAGNGYVRSEGVAVVYLKPLSRALQDKDRIYGVIRGSLVNQDGYTAEGLTVPSLKGQQALLETVYSQAGVDPAKVEYVEAHGPGTAVGDPIEAAAIGSQIGQRRYADRALPLAIGSIKGNIGHLEGAAGIVGFIKATLTLFHRQIPPQLNHHERNPEIDWDGLHLDVPVTLTNFPDSKTNDEVFVGINSFGAGGTNAHVIIGEVPSDGNSLVSSPTSSDSEQWVSVSASHPRVFVVSARSDTALKQVASELADHLRKQKSPSLSDTAYTLNKRRGCHHKIAIIPATNKEMLCARLDQVDAGKVSKDILMLDRKSTKTTTAAAASTPRVAFLFSGQGGQWLGMGAKLARDQPLFRETLAAFDKIYAPLAGFSIVKEISTDNANDPSRLSNTVIAQSGIAAIQIALAETLIGYGVNPSAIVGHSIGEVAAAYISGALTLEEAVKVIYIRSRVQAKAAGKGTMLAVGLSASEAEEFITRNNAISTVEIAAMNGLKMTTLAGERSALETVAADVQESGSFAKFVKVEVPYHSQFMDPHKMELVETLSTYQGKQTHPGMDLYSTVTTAIESGTHLTGEYWFDNVRKPVRYLETVTRMLEDGCEYLVEIGPHPVLVSGTQDIVNSLDRAAYVLPSMIRDNELEPIARVIGAAHAIGVPADIMSFNGSRGRVTDLPLYPFQRQRFWYENPECEQARLSKGRHPFYLDSTQLTDDGRASLRLRLSTGTSPFLKDHSVETAMVFPMTGHIETAYMAADRYTPGSRLWLQDLRFEAPLILSPAEDFAPQFILEITSMNKDYVIATRAPDAKPESPWKVCSRGRINMLDDPSTVTPEQMSSVQARIQSATEVDVEQFYKHIGDAGLIYGEAFQCVRSLWRRGNEIFAHVELPAAIAHEAARFRFHPALLDASFHIVNAYVQHNIGVNAVYLPYTLEAIEVVDSRGISTVWSNVKVKSQTDETLNVDILVYADDGRLLVAVKSLVIKRLGSTKTIRSLEHEITFEHAPNGTEYDDRVPRSLTNIVSLDLGLATDIDDACLFQNVFPTVPIHRLPLEEAARNFDADKFGFRLDRRVLIYIPAVMNMACPDVEKHIELVYRALTQVANWLKHDAGSSTVLVLTRGGCLTSADTQCDPASASVQAAVRVMRNELPRISVQVVDLPLRGSWKSLSSLDEALGNTRISRHDCVVAVRSSGRYYPQVTTVDSASEDRSSKPVPARGGSYYSKPVHGGSFGEIAIHDLEPTVLGPEDVAIEVHATGLNYNDVITSMGMQSDQATPDALSGDNLGMEVAGVVTRVGASVSGMEVGARVMARVTNGLGGSVVVNHQLVVPVPPMISLAEASCLPMAYMTAYYALVYLGRLQEGESILIHSGAGGVGIAAIQVAKLFGARIYATAGNPQRRSWIQAIEGVEAVFDSRSVTFCDDVKKVTYGKGVDLVLNSSNGNIFSQSIACLAPFGRCLQLGKSDVYRNMRVGLQPLRKNCTLFVVDVDSLPVQKPELHRQLLLEVSNLLNQGKLLPLPVTRFPFAEFPKALKSLSRSSAIGKVAVEMLEHEFVQSKPRDQLRLSSREKTYLITGGTAGLGLQLARFLVKRGARHLLLVSRSGPKSAEHRATIDDLIRQGARVIIKQADVSNYEEIAAIFENTTDYPPIAGVMHCAGVINNLPSSETTMSAFWKVFRPKALGAWNLHRVTQNKNLDFFMMASSISIVIAQPGQLSYASANQFLDALAAHRQSCGLPGLSLSLGVLGSYAGMTTADLGSRILDSLEAQGLLQLDFDTVEATLERLIIRKACHRVLGRISFSAFVDIHNHLRQDAYYAKVQHEKGVADNDGPTGSAKDDRPVIEVLTAGLAKVIGVEPSRIEPKEEINTYAFDSLTLTQVRGMIARDLRVTLPLMRLYNNPTIQALANEIQDLLANGKEEIHKDSTQKYQHAAVVDLVKELTPLSPWIFQGTGAGKRVVCFHSMGIGASLFTPFLVNPPPGLDLVAVQLPGRETRADEELPSFSSVVASIVAEIQSWDQPPEVFWGHSFGGIIAFEVLRALRRNGASPLPALMITGTIAPQLIGVWKRRELLMASLRGDSSADYLLAVTRYVDEPDFVLGILEMLHHDAPLLLDYEYQEEPELGVPIVAFSARQDDIAYREELAHWGVQSTQFTLREVDGDHWFLRRNKEVLLQALVDLAQVAGTA